MNRCATAAHTPTPGELAHRAKDEARDAGYERAGLFLLLIDPDDAAGILGALDAQEVMGICSVIARLGTVSERDARRIMEEYGVRPSSVRFTATGGPAAVRRLLTAAFDAGHAERLLGRIRDGLS
jgi:flagellar motor switch protein FliG